MKARRFHFRAPTIFGTPLKYGAPVFIGFTVIVSGLSDAHGGDILRGGSASSRPKPGSNTAAGASTPDATDAARANAKDTLARTTRTLDAMRALQNAARTAALANSTNHLAVNLPVVPNGLGTGGLNPATNPARWTGANAPVQTVGNGKTTVTIKQTTQQALLEWQTLNVGKNTTLTFDQSKGGGNASQWIAFNKVTDPSGNPTRILGSIKADGQVYLINPNGVIFGGGSQVNARGLTVSTLPVNENLVANGLLNNRDSQFLFSGLFVPGGSDGTPDFDPGPAPAQGYGDVTVQQGAVLQTPSDSVGSGGRVTLVGANVTNEGTISTPAGQTILAAGLQVALTAHDSSDPGLRGLDVAVGDVGTYGGTVTNSGLIEISEGSATLTGKSIGQLGVIESSTSVGLNGRIDLLANYGAVGNPNYDTVNPSTGGTGPQFLFQKTGSVTLGQGSLTRILPTYSNKETAPGLELPERSAINIDGLAIHFDKDSDVFAPNADVVVRAGTRTYADADGNRTIFDANGNVESGIASDFTGKNQKFLYSGGQIYVDNSASISVAGSVDVFVSAAQNLLTVDLRGAELADSPLQRDSGIRGVPITVDMRKSGIYNGRFWQGTPLADLTGLAGLIQRNVAQLTAAGGNVSLNAGDSIVIRSGSIIDVSGGYFRNEGGTLQTSAVVSNGRLIPIELATPDRKYDSVFNGANTIVDNKWGVSETFGTPLFSDTTQPSYIEGAAGGHLTLSAAGMAIDGKLRGVTIRGDQQRSAPPAKSRIDITFKAEREVAIPGGGSASYISYSPTPPEVTFANRVNSAAVSDFSLVNGSPAGLSADRIGSVVLSSILLGEDGFDSLSVSNPDGSIIVPETVTLESETGGSIKLDGANITVNGAIVSRSGSISLGTYNISPSFTAESDIINGAGTVPPPAAAAGRGLLTLGVGARLNASGLISNDLPGSAGPADEPVSVSGGGITLHSYNTLLAGGSIIDVSGGVHVSERGVRSYGNSGSITIVSGTDDGFPGVIGGDLALHSTLLGYSGAKGGTLSIQASTIQVGGAVSTADLTLGAEFFRTGGFTKYSLSAIGKRSDAAPPAGQFESYDPAIVIATNTQIAPVAESLIANVDAENGNSIRLDRVWLDEGLRSPVSLEFKALGYDDSSTPESLEVRGDLVMKAGAEIKVAPGANVLLKGQTTTILGSVTAPGGTITVSGASAFPFTASQRALVTSALPTVHLGEAARLSAAGIFLAKPDLFGRRSGTVFAGGTISLSGNIVAESGGLLDVSGTSAVLDRIPASIVNDGSQQPGSGLLTPPLATQGIATRVDSNAGSIILAGSEMLLSDATLRGKAGGDTATGGTLSVSSGKFYLPNATRTGADINLIVTQSGNVVKSPHSQIGVGLGLLDGNGQAYGNLGAFSVSRFSAGAFANLSLGGNYSSSGAVPVGGNVNFQGDVRLDVVGSLRLAAGGIVTADGNLSISAAYAAIGQGFRPPDNPGDEYIPFKQSPANPGAAIQFAPVFGTGRLELEAGYIDIGTLSLQNIGKADFKATNGEIRGNGTLHIAGDLTLDAAAIYPTTGSKFSIFAYDHGGQKGSITFRASRTGSVPLSAGGTLEAYASTINQSGVLRAPAGTITLGWDGTDLDPSDSDLDSPLDPIAGITIAAPVSSSISLEKDSVTSVSSYSEDGTKVLIPYGVSPDGKSWIDPSGQNISLAGLPGKSVSISADDVQMASGAVIDVRGGGDLLATRWVPGNGGSVDILGSASSVWGSSKAYTAGDLVTYNGETWSARTSHSGQTPEISRYWTKVATSYAIIPSAGLPYAPYSAFNTGPNAGLLSGNPGYVNPGLNVGDTVTLDGGGQVPAGTYTLLPSRYALLPGAFLITPVSNTTADVVYAADGSRQVSGYLGNRFSAPESLQATRTRFEIASAEVFKQRAEYQTYQATVFLGGLSKAAESKDPQRLPADAGNIRIHGGSGLNLAGRLLTSSQGRGSAVDISSFSNILIHGSATPAPQAGTVALSAETITSWGAASLLLGGVRNTRPDGTVSIDVRTSGLTLNNPGSLLEAPDIILVSKQSLDVKSGSSINTTGTGAFDADPLYLEGDGTLVRVSRDSTADVTRTAVTNSGTANLHIGSDVNLQGPLVVLDSTNGMSLSPSVRFEADRLVLASGGVSILLDGTTTGPAPGGTQLVLDGATLDSLFHSDDVTLRSYGGIDLYGSGNIGDSTLDRLTLSSSGIRGFDTAGSNVSITAKNLDIDNTTGSAAVANAATSSARLNLRGEIIRMGENTVTVSGYDTLAVDASDRWIVGGVGSFNVMGALEANTPLLTGEAGAIHSIISTGRMNLTGSPTAPPAASALGAGISLQGSSITANTNILLPSGELGLTATSGDVVVGGNLSVAGTSKRFNDLVRFTNAGEINLTSRTGDVILSQGGSVSVSGNPTGGNAGSLNVNAANGSFSNLASVTGTSSFDYQKGSFSLDIRSVAATGAGSLASLNSNLETGGFTASRNLRIRNGDVLIDHQVRSREFSLAADNGSILVTGRIDASGVTGGSITLSAHGDLTLASGALLTARADQFNSAGKGGSILLEAGTQKDGIANQNALLSLKPGSAIDLSVSEFVEGRYDTPGSSAFDGKFTGTLHLRAPRTAANNGLGIGPIQSFVVGASSVTAEGFKVYQPANGVLNIALKNQIHSDNTAFLGTAGSTSTNETAMRAKLLSGAPSASALGPVLVIAPGVEIINPAGDLTLGLANPTGTSNAEGRATADWDLSSFRYGSSGAAGVLTLRAKGDLVFNNSLSDGFTPIAQGSASVFFGNGNSLLWLAKLTTINEALPVNNQSWTYRLTAGADTGSSDFRDILPDDQLQTSKGSVIVGEFYPAVPNSLTTGTAAAVGANGQTADTIRISTNTTDLGNRFEVVRTGTGSIDVNAGRDIQLRNPFSTIYTAGVALPVPTTVFTANDFVLPVIPTNETRHPGQTAGGITLGAIQQLYQPTWSMAGGNLSLNAARDIGRFTKVNGQIVADSSKQMPTNWLYRRGFVDSATGRFSDQGGFGEDPNIQNSTNLTDTATSTTWWIDYSNFFQGFGTLGGGNIDLNAGRDAVNADAVAPTNARMAGRTKNPDFGIIPGAAEYITLAPDQAKLVEYGGGDINITTGRNIDGGIFYIERGEGTLNAGASITTNSSRSPSRGILANEAPYDSLTWLPTTLFVGKSHFDVVAKGDILLGPVANPFLLPQGINNRFWYKTYFSTFSEDAGATVTAYGGDVTHRSAVTLPGSNRAESILGVWFRNQNQFNSGLSSSSYQPWLRLAESNVGAFDSIFQLTAPNLASTSFSGDIHLVGDMTLAPSPNGGLELAAAGSVIGLNPTGIGTLQNKNVTVWTSAKINVSDAALSSIPGTIAPLANQSLTGRNQIAATLSNAAILAPLTRVLTETGSYSGEAGTSVIKQALHGDDILHANDPDPVQISALGGDITGFTLFSPKRALIAAQRDISDVAFYIQNLINEDISLVSAGRDIVLFNETSELRSVAENFDSSNIIGDGVKSTSSGSTSNAEAGDLQVSGPGVLEVLAGRNVDLGTGANFADGTGSGITSIGNNRNPNLSFTGADLIVLAGTSNPAANGPALGLADSNLDIDAFIGKYLDQLENIESSYLDKLRKIGGVTSLSDEQKAIVAFGRFYQILRDAGRSAAKDGDYSAGFDAVRSLFGEIKPLGEIEVRAREIRTLTGGAISLGVPGGGITLASQIFGNPLTPPGIVTEFGGAISTFTNGNVDIGQARIFTLRGGDITMWSSHGNIAAGTSPRTVVTAPPTRVIVDPTSASVQTDLGGLATGGGIGVLAAVKDVKPGNVDLIAPNGFVDAGDAGIRVTGNLNIAAQVVLNSSNISTGGKTTGSSASTSSAPTVSSVTSASNTAAATTSVKSPDEQKNQETPKAEEQTLSLITVEVIGYGGAAATDEDEEKDKTKSDSTDTTENQ